MSPLQLFDSAETIKWLRCRRLELKRELRRLGPTTTDDPLATVARERFLKRAIRFATLKLDVLQGKKKA